MLLWISLGQLAAGQVRQGLRRLDYFLTSLAFAQA